jgi:hypothetical protein
VAATFDALRPDYVKMMLEGIVNFEIAVTRIETRWKLSQNRGRREQELIAAELEKSSDSGRALRSPRSLESSLPSSRYFFAVWPPADDRGGARSWAKEAGRPRHSRGENPPHARVSRAGRARKSARCGAPSGESACLPIEKAQYWKHNRIVWAGPRETPAALAALVEALHACLRQAGYTSRRARLPRT